MKQNKKRFPWLMAAAVVLAAGIVVCAVGYFSVKAENDRLQEELLQAEEDLSLIHISGYPEKAYEMGKRLK